MKKKVPGSKKKGIFFFQNSIYRWFDIRLVIYGLDLVKLDYFHEDNVPFDVKLMFFLLKILPFDMKLEYLNQFSTNPRFHSKFVIYGFDLLKLDYFHEDNVPFDVKWIFFLLQIVTFDVELKYLCQFSTNPRFQSRFVIYGFDLLKLEYFYEDNVTLDVFAPWFFILLFSNRHVWRELEISSAKFVTRLNW